MIIENFDKIYGCKCWTMQGTYIAEKLTIPLNHNSYGIQFTACDGNKGIPTYNVILTNDFNLGIYDGNVITPLKVVKIARVDISYIGKFMVTLSILIDTI